MTDRHAAYLVILEEDIREDDAEEGVLNAIRMLRGVASVQPVTASPGAEMVGRMRADQQWREALLGLVRNGRPVRSVPEGGEQQS